MMVLYNLHGDKRGDHAETTAGATGAQSTGSDACTTEESQQADPAAAHNGHRELLEGAIPCPERYQHHLVPSHKAIEDPSRPNKTNGKGSQAPVQTSVFATHDG